MRILELLIFCALLFFNPAPSVAQNISVTNSIYLFPDSEGWRCLNALKRSLRDLGESAILYGNGRKSLTVKSSGAYIFMACDDHPTEGYVIFSASIAAPTESDIGVGLDFVSKIFSGMNEQVPW